MSLIKKSLIASVILVNSAVFAQTCPDTDAGRNRFLSLDIQYLSSDEMGGRPPGTEFEKMAADYVIEEFRKAGLIETEGGWIQSFPVQVNASVLEPTYFQFKKEKLNLNSDFFPLKYASNGVVKGKTTFVGYGITAPEKEYDDYAGKEDLEGKIFVMDVGSPDGIHPHSEYIAHHNLNKRIERAKEKGAAGVILVNRTDLAEAPKNKIVNIQDKGLPVVFLAHEKAAKYYAGKKSRKVEFAVTIQENYVNARNVIGYIDNGVEYTVAIGAHFDHLGMGESGNSLHKGEPAIHNGADDNASGTAGVIELAREFASDSSFKKFNYLFIAFSAEEMGLLGSQYWTNNPTYPLERISMMINMDMIGRLKDGQLAVGGVGTSPYFKEYFSSFSCDNITIKTSESGVGPSDHTSFYKKDIPVLFFFTGTHEDYHKPSDDFEKINVTGTGEIIGVVKDFVGSLPEGKLPFKQTVDQDSRKAPRFSVTLGVVPDYMYEGEGMRIDGITQGKPAAEAGLLVGDVVVQIGQIPVTDMMSYMQALSAFKKGDMSIVVFMRNGKREEAKIKF